MCPATSVEEMASRQPTRLFVQHQSFFNGAHLFCQSSKPRWQSNGSGSSAAFVKAALINFCFISFRSEGVAVIQ
jgi:hypothetical protein